MSDNYFSQDEPTLPANYPGQQGNAYGTQRPQRKPYQFPPQQEPYTPQGKMVLPQPSQPNAYPQRQPASHANQANQGGYPGYPGSPQPTYPGRQPAQSPGAFSPTPAR